MVKIHSPFLEEKYTRRVPVKISKKNFFWEECIITHIAETSVYILIPAEIWKNPLFLTKLYCYLVRDDICRMFTTNPLKKKLNKIPHPSSNWENSKKNSKSNSFREKQQTILSFSFDLNSLLSFNLKFNLFSNILHNFFCKKKRIYDDLCLYLF